MGGRSIRLFFNKCGSIVGSYLKEYLAEKAAMKQLKNSIINKSILISSKTGFLNSKEAKIKKIYRFGLESRGGSGAFYNSLMDPKFKLAQEIEKMVIRLAAFLKQKELKGTLRVFFLNGRLILQLLLYTCKINITYLSLIEGLSTQVIIFTTTAGGALGFTLSWLSVGASLVAPPVLASSLLLQSFTQQLLNQRQYLNFKHMINKLANDPDMQDILRVAFVEGKAPTPNPGRLKMGPPDFDRNSALKHDFAVKSGKDLEEFIKSKMNEELGLIENPTETELEKIIQRRVKRNPKGKTVYYQDFIQDLGDNMSDSDIIDTEIIEEPIRIEPDL